VSAFDEKKNAARSWEIAASCWCRSERGYYVLPTYDFSGKDDNKAPKILSPESVADLVAPDLMVWGRGETRFLEVKYKTKADTYRKTNTLTTGINRRLWRHYRDVERLLKVPIWILFIHQQERECRADTLANLSNYIDHEYSGWNMGPSGMVFWPYLEIPRWFGIEKLERYLPVQEVAA
jgi:hypothetical protein